MGGALSSLKGLFYELFFLFLFLFPNKKKKLHTQAIEHTDDAPNATFVKNKIFFKNNLQASLRFFPTPSPRLPLTPVFNFNPSDKIVLKVAAADEGFVPLCALCLWTLYVSTARVQQSNDG